jgi:hypothetical protein
MRDDKLKFDSDELGDLSLDWGDVAELISPRRNTCLFEGRVTATGTLLMRDGMVMVGGETEQRFKREDLLVIVPGEPTEWNFWSGNLSVNFALRRGNTERTDLQAVASAQRDTTLSRLKLEYLGNFGATESETDIDNHRLNGRYEIFLTRRFFVMPLAVVGFRDPFQNVAWRRRRLPSLQAQQVQVGRGSGRRYAIHPV